MALRYLDNVTTLDFDAKNCIGCGMCTEVCVHGVFALANGTARIVDRDACMECGACAMNCPVEAVSVRPGVGCAAAIVAEWFGRLKKSGKGRQPGCC